MLTRAAGFPTLGPPWLPDENFNKKPNNAKKRPEKGQTDCLKANKKDKLYLRYCHSFVTKNI